MVVGLLLLVHQNIEAHCDTLDGPVIQDAQLALEKKDVTVVLKWVKERDEEESVAAGREFVEAYVTFVHYAERIYLDATAQKYIHQSEAEIEESAGHHHH